MNMDLRYLYIKYVYESFFFFMVYILTAWKSFIMSMIYHFGTLSMTSIFI